MSLSPTLTTLIALWGVVTIYIVGSRKLRTRYPLPPGPTPLPFIGNLLDLPLKNEAVTYNAWANKYGAFLLHRCVQSDPKTSFKGDLVYATVMGHRLLFVNSPQIANDLFEKRFVNYSDRNKLPMINDL